MLPSEPARPDQGAGDSAADKALKDAGGEIMPTEFQAKPLPLAEPPGAAPREVDVPGSRQLKEDPAPVPPPDSPAQAAWKERLNLLINVELNVFASCSRSVRNMVNAILAEMPADSADIGEAQFGAGKRTPLEEQEPLIALEVYKQVRRNMREEQKAQEESELSALRALVAKALGPEGLRRARR